LNQDRSDGYGPVAGLIRELRIRWRLFRRGHSLGHRHVVLLIVAVGGFWIALSLYHGLGTDALLKRQLTQLQAQSQSLSRQVQAQREELKTASSAASQSEIARSEGLVPPTDKVYAVENPVEAAGPVAIQQGAVEVGQTAQDLVQALLGVTPPAS
jgi:cell division protein FtsB